MSPAKTRGNDHPSSSSTLTLVTHSLLITLSHLSPIITTPSHFLKISTLYKHTHKIPTHSQTGGLMPYEGGAREPPWTTKSFRSDVKKISGTTLEIM